MCIPRSPFAGTISFKYTSKSGAEYANSSQEHQSSHNAGSLKQNKSISCNKTWPQGEFRHRLLLLLILLVISLLWASLLLCTYYCWSGFNRTNQNSLRAMCNIYCNNLGEKISTSIYSPPPVFFFFCRDGGAAVNEVLFYLFIFFCDGAAGVWVNVSHWTGCHLEDEPQGGRMIIG